MMFKDIQVLEHAARTAMAGNDDQHQPTQQESFKYARLGLILIMLVGAAYYLLG